MARARAGRRPDHRRADPRHVRRLRDAGPLMQWWEGLLPTPGWRTRPTRAGTTGPPSGASSTTGMGKGTRPGGPLLMAPHAAEALAERLWVPRHGALLRTSSAGVSAPRCTWHRRRHAALVVVGLFLALIWTRRSGCWSTRSARLGRAARLLWPWSWCCSFAARRRAAAASSEPDWLLFGMPLANHLFFAGHALTCGDGPHSPPTSRSSSTGSPPSPPRARHQRRVTHDRFRLQRPFAGLRFHNRCCVAG